MENVKVTRGFQQTMAESAPFYDNDKKKLRIEIEKNKMNELFFIKC